jgi:CheY-like chemotaxis protein
MSGPSCSPRDRSWGDHTKKSGDMATILVVDQHRERVPVLVNLVLPHRLIACTSTADAWECLAQETPRLLLVDYQVLGWIPFMRQVSQRVNQRPPQLAGIGDLARVAAPHQRAYIRICACQQGQARSFLDIPTDAVDPTQHAWLRVQLMALMQLRYSSLG